MSYFYFSRRGLAFGILTAFTAFLLLSWYWSREPAPFEVPDPLSVKALSASEGNDGAPLPRGYVSASTLIQVVETMLDKPGGYLSNDRMLPGLWLDNIPSWEFGVLTQVRDFTHALRLDFSRAHSQSRDRPELQEAETRFAFAHDAWVLPSAEEEYRRGVALLDAYRNSLAASPNAKSDFVVRAENLDNWLRRVELRLGACTLQLRASAGRDKYDSSVLTSQQEGVDEPTAQPVSRREVDDVFFESRGTAWALYHVLKAIKYDYQSVLDNQLAMGAVNRALSNLHAALQPMRSPVVLNGKDFGPTPNHSLMLAAYLANAHLAISDVRQLLLNA